MEDVSDGEAALQLCYAGHGAEAVHGDGTGQLAQPGNGGAA